MAAQPFLGAVSVQILFIRLSVSQALREATVGFSVFTAGLEKLATSVVTGNLSL
jgi:hypothetical protein